MDNPKESAENHEESLDPFEELDKLLSICRLAAENSKNSNPEEFHPEELDEGFKMTLSSELCYRIFPAIVGRPPTQREIIKIVGLDPNSKKATRLINNDLGMKEALRIYDVKKEPATELGYEKVYREESPCDTKSCSHDSKINKKSKIGMILPKDKAVALKKRKQVSSHQGRPPYMISFKETNERKTAKEYFQKLREEEEDFVIGQAASRLDTILDLTKQMPLEPMIHVMDVWMDIVRNAVSYFRQHQKELHIGKKEVSKAEEVYRYIKAVSGMSIIWKKKLEGLTFNQLTIYKALKGKNQDVLSKLFPTYIDEMLWLKPFAFPLKVGREENR